MKAQSDRGATKSNLDPGQSSIAGRRRCRFKVWAALLALLAAGAVPIDLTGRRPTVDSATTAGTTPAPSSAAFPNGANTGPAAAGFTSLEPYDGPQRITENGTEIKGKIIPAGLIIDAKGVTLQGNVIHGPTSASFDQAALEITDEAVGAVITDNEIRGDSKSVASSPVSGIKIVGEYTQFLRNNVYWIAGDGVSIYGGNAVTSSNWVHDFVLRTGVHYDAVSYPGDDTAAPGLIRHNTVELWTSDGMTATLSFPDRVPNVRVEDNLLAGGNYTIVAGGGGITVAGNWFWTKFSPKCGVYGVQAHMGRVKGVNWTGNVWTSDGVRPGGPAE